MDKRVLDAHIVAIRSRSWELNNANADMLKWLQKECPLRCSSADLLAYAFSIGDSALSHVAITELGDSVDFTADDEHLQLALKSEMFEVARWVKNKLELLSSDTQTAVWNSALIVSLRRNRFKAVVWLVQNHNYGFHADGLREALRLSSIFPPDEVDRAIIVNIVCDNDSDDDSDDDN